MLNIKSILLTLMVLMFTNFQGLADVPGNSEITKWLGSDEKIEIEAIKEFQISMHERAYIATVNFLERGRYCYYGNLLILPDQKKAFEIKDISGREIEVLDLDKDGVSELEITGVGSGQGQTTVGKYLLSFTKDYAPSKIRYITASDDNLGSGGFNGYYDFKTLWEYKDLDGDGSLDVIETRSYKKWIDNNKVKIGLQNYTLIEHLLFKNGTLSRANAEMKPDRAVISKDVQNREPMNPVSSFDQTAEKIYCFAEFRNIKKEMPIKFLWFKQGYDTEKIFYAAVKQRIKPSSKWRSWSSITVPGIVNPKGNWTVFIVDNNNLILDSVEFRIE